MKKIFLLVALIATTSSQLLFAQDTKPTSLTSLLTSYYDTKDALIKSNSADAAAHAGEFLKTITAVDMKALPAADDYVYVFAGKTNFRCEAYIGEQGYRPSKGTLC